MCARNGDRLTDPSMRMNVCVRRGSVVSRTHSSNVTSLPLSSTIYPVATMTPAVPLLTTSKTENTATSDPTIPNKPYTDTETTDIETNSAVNIFTSSTRLPTKYPPATSESTTMRILSSNASISTTSSTTTVTPTEHAPDVVTTLVQTTDTETTNEPTTANPTTEPTARTSSVSKATTNYLPTTRQPTTTEVTTSPGTTKGSVTESVSTTETMTKSSTSATTNEPETVDPSVPSLKILAVDQCSNSLQISDLPTVAFQTLNLLINNKLQSVTYDSVDKEVFWSDILLAAGTLGISQVCGSKLDGTSRRCKSIDDYCKGPRKIAIDETDRKLYIACSSNSRIVMTNLVLTDYSLQTLVDTVPVNVQFIATIPGAVVYATGQEIQKFTTSYSRSVLTQESHAIQGLTVDRAQNKIHYAVGTITAATDWYKMNYDGTGKMSHATRVNSPSDLEWFDNQFYTVENGDIYTVDEHGSVTNWNLNSNEICIMDIIIAVI
ncbi:serine-rich adhesin for platelets-like [Lytechinus variegatus]|uniref:serine-rich adhesin for platelets-like n=1 Tax=Lytechinus variegatus TaxID=7654 RepID=UPI001BB227C5|nr:serine-rich adhesin for platelets-like [Lytechinus variegatus]